MFGKKIVEVNEIDNTKIKELELVISNLKSEHSKEIENLKKENESEKRITKNEVHIEVQKAIETSLAENNALKLENATLKKEVEILEKAFENMGFDVKDMKEILNKLVDGIVSGNKVNIIK